MVVRATTRGLPGDFFIFPWMCYNVIRLRQDPHLIGRGFYFITICVKYRIKFFGDVVDGKMVLNKYGEIVDQQLQWMEQQYPWVKLDEYIIMPNHVHGVIKINRCAHVGTTLGLSLHHKRKLYHRQKNLLSKSIYAFKTTLSKMIHQINDWGFCWQRSYYDRIIRNERELNRIRKYIQQNPEKWKRDRNNLGVLGTYILHPL